MVRSTAGQVIGSRRDGIKRQDGPTPDLRIIIIEREAAPSRFSEAINWFTERTPTSPFTA